MYKSMKFYWTDLVLCRAISCNNHQTVRQSGWLILTMFAHHSSKGLYFSIFLITLWLDQWLGQWILDGFAVLCNIDENHLLLSLVFNMKWRHDHFKCNLSLCATSMTLSTPRKLFLIFHGKLPCYQIEEKVLFHCYGCSHCVFLLA